MTIKFVAAYMVLVILHGVDVLQLPCVVNYKPLTKRGVG
jgi:hypothetical protein